ncbi:amino acid adenylation domain-containing protein [Streptomyces sp. NPDC088124]|uniref:amino acid adenylation domain-containing protein n=1 Tax=Streptomyces sp. NPDC088124 TaxID=3154654 RepID=UPI00343A995A
MSDTPTSTAPTWEIHPSIQGTRRPATAPQHLRAATLGTARLRLRICGDVDTTRLRTATEQVLSAHTVLRQRLQSSGAGLEVHTAQHTIGTPAAGRPDAVPLARLTASSDGLYLELHPAAGVVDGTGLLRTAQSIAAAYRAAGDAIASRPAPATVEAFFAGLLTDPEGAPGRTFWQKHRPLGAGDIARALALRPAPPGQYRSSVPVRLDGTALGGLRTLAGAAGGSLSGVVLTAWRLLLTRLAPEENGALALFVSGPTIQLPHTIGVLGRYVPVPAVPETPARLLADRVRDTAEEVARAADYGDFFAASGAEEAFTVGFRHLSAPDVLALGPGGHAVIEAVDAPLDRIAVELHSLRRGRDLDLHVSVDTAVAGPDVAVRLADWLGQLLARMAQPSAPVQFTCDIARLPAADSRLTGPERPVPAVTVLDAFDVQATRTPDACSATDDRTTASYRQLQADSTTLAGRLAAAGVGDGDLVGVLMSRRVGLLTALLAVWRCGARYVPLDPTLPPGRIRTLLGDATPRLLLTDADTADLPALSDVDGLTVLDVDSAVREASPTVRSTAAPSGSRSQGTAYLIYTSGSTGRPKGVPITHAALMNYLLWAGERYDTPGGSGTVVHSSIAADMTVTSLFLPLLTGQCVTLVPSNDLHALAQVLAGLQDLSPLKVTPGLLRLLPQLLTGEQMAHSVRHLVVGGEQLTGPALKELDAPGLLVTNEYGPTEATVGCTAHTVRLGEAVPDPVPVGQPVWNTTIELRTPGDDDLVLPGCVGELVVLGPQVADGYHHRPEETAARFITADGSRAYRTGDLARRRPDGQLEMLGRIDQQVKIHGYRVEPGEIEATLTRDPHIAQAVVLAHPSRNDGSPLLAAFLVAALSADPASVVERAQALAADELPFYARPDRYLVLPELPLLPGGKTNRQALAAMTPAAEGGQLLDCGDPAADLLARLWEDILGRPPASEAANFFADGGNSLKAVFFARRAQREGLPLTVHDVLQRRTLGQLTSACHAAAGTAETSAAAAPGPIPLSCIQSAVLTARADADQWTLRYLDDAPHAVVDPARLEAALAVVVRAHPALRSVFTRTESGWSASLRAPSPVPVGLLRLDSVRTPAEQERLLRGRFVEAEQQLHLAGPLVSLFLIQDGACRARIAWVVHHLVADLVSLQILTEELWHAYDHPAPHGLLRDDGYLAWLAAAGARPSPVLAADSWTSESRCTTASRPGPRAWEALVAAQQRGPRWPVALLAGALLAALADVRPDLPARVCVELHGRDVPGHDLVSAVGWLTAFRPLHAQRTLLADPQSLTAALHGQLYSSVPPAGPLPPVALNYLGDLAPGSDVDLPAVEAGVALFGLEAVCFTRAGVLEVRWRACPGWMPDATLARLAEAFAHHAAIAPGPPDTSALPQSDLDRINAAFGKEGS